MFLGIATPLPFSSVFIGIILVTLAVYSSRAIPAKPEPAGGPAPSISKEGPPTAAKPILTTPEEVADVIQTDTVEIEIGYGLIPLADPSQGGKANCL